MLQFLYGVNTPQYYYYLLSLECAVYLSCGHLFLCRTCSWFHCGQASVYVVVGI
jgi:hypothetical protein